MSEFKVGDTVRIVRRSALGSLLWTSEMDRNIGQIGVIKDVCAPNNIQVKIGSDHWNEWYYNRQSLELVGAARANILPEDDDARAAILLATCLLDYFPNACAAVAAHSAKSNAKHNPGQPPHWARDKSTGHRDKIVRHLIDAGGFDKDGNRHSTALAWRGLALLEDELIAEGATPGRNAKGSPDALTNPQHNCIEDEV